MKAKIIALAVLFGAPLLVSAQQLQTKVDMYAPVKLSNEWKYSPAIWDQYSGISSNQTPAISLGRSRVTLGGPLIQTFQRPRDWSDLSRGEKFLSLPIVNLFVPQPMPRPSGTGKTLNGGIRAISRGKRWRKASGQSPGWEVWFRLGSVRPGGRASVSSPRR